MEKSAAYWDGYNSILFRFKLAQQTIDPRLAMRTARHPWQGQNPPDPYPQSQTWRPKPIRRQVTHGPPPGANVTYPSTTQMPYAGQNAPDPAPQSRPSPQPRIQQARQQASSPDLWRRMATSMRSPQQQRQQITQELTDPDRWHKMRAAINRERAWMGRN